MLTSLSDGVCSSWDDRAAVVKGTWTFDYKLTRFLPRRGIPWTHKLNVIPWLSKLDVFCFRLSKLFVSSSARDIVVVTLASTAVETAIAQCTSRWAMARGHRLNTSIVLAAVHGLSGLFRTVSAVEPSSSSHSVPVPNRPSRLRGRKAT